MTESEITHIITLASNTSSGKWKVKHNPNKMYHTVVTVRGKVEDTICDCMWRHDAEFCAEAKDAVFKMAEVIRKQRVEIHRLEKHAEANDEVIRSLHSTIGAKQVKIDVLEGALTTERPSGVV